MPTTCQPSSRPSQEWLASHNAYNNGKMDGFVRTPISVTARFDTVGGVAMGYWTGDDLPFTYSLARGVPHRGPVVLLGTRPDFPNRRYLIAGTSAGMTDDGGISVLSTSPSPPRTGPSSTCSTGTGSAGRTTSASYPTGATPELFPANDAMPEAATTRRSTEFFTDAAAGTLPAFSLLDPDYGTQSQENPQNIVVGEALIAQVVHALGASPLWRRRSCWCSSTTSTAATTTTCRRPRRFPRTRSRRWSSPASSRYDGFARYGFRVPSVVVSAVRQAQATSSHVLYDHTSVLALIERKWNLPALTYRDANANDLTDFLDLSALAARQPTFPTPARPGRARQHARGAGLLDYRPGNDPAARVRDWLILQAGTRASSKSASWIAAVFRDRK